MLLLLSLSAMTACSGGNNDGPTPPDQPVVSPDTPVPDPTGSISLSMRDYDNGHTYLDDIYISKENFTSYHDCVKFASIGTVNGLGNIVGIPSAGWTDRISVKPGEGYVAYDTSRDKYYRLFVEDYIIATNGGIIGADIKYQAPFKGADEAIALNETALAFDAEGGSQALFFANKNLLVYSISSDQDWCHVRKATDLETPFLYDGLVISVDKAPMNASDATVKVTTAYGKTKEIHVSYAGYDPYLIMGDTKELENVPCEGGVYNISLTTNEPSTLSAASNDYWIVTSIINGSQEMHAKAARIKYIDGLPLTRGASYNDAKDVFTLQIAVADNSSQNERTGRCGANTQFCSVATDVHQTGKTWLYPTNENSHTFQADGKDLYGRDASFSFNFNTSYTSSELEITTDFGGAEPWFSAYCGINSVSVTVLGANMADTEREGTVTVKSADGLHSIAYIIKQKGTRYEVKVDGLADNGNYGIDRNGGTFTLKVSTNIPDLTFTSSAPDWVTASYSAGNLVLRIKSTDRNRTAKITCSDSRGSFEVHQSKYAVGDKYSEGSISGTVVMTDNGNGLICRLIGTVSKPFRYQWSTENVETGCKYDGKKNMEIIRAIPGWEELYPAFAAVETLNVGGVSGWYLPDYTTAKKYSVRYYSGLTGGVEIWTSEEYNVTNAKTSANYQTKYSTLPVVAVHDFNW